MTPADDTSAAKESRVFLTAEWRDLVMLNFVVEPEILLRRLPRGCELDEWEGRTFVSVVGFRFLETRVLGVPIPGHRDFEEVNLRFYVRREVAGERRRGVVFVKELVPRRAVATVARWAYGENYVALPMEHSIDSASEVGSRRIGYRWRREGVWESVEATTSGRPEVPEPGSEESFITEHYWGYARRRDGETVEYRVEHPPWRVWRASQASFECDAATLYAPELAEALAGAPSSAFVAEGSEVVVRRGRRLAREHGAREGVGA